jgi:hypothetical protein
MWATKNHTPYAVERNWTRDTQGRHHWIVSVRATFDGASNGKLALVKASAPDDE